MNLFSWDIYRRRKFRVHSRHKTIRLFLRFLNQAFLNQDKSAARKTQITNTKSTSNIKKHVNSSFTTCGEDLLCFKRWSRVLFSLKYLYNDFFSLLVLKHFEKAIWGEYFRLLKILERFGNLQRIWQCNKHSSPGLEPACLTFGLHVTISQHRYLEYAEIQPVFAADCSSFFTLINFLTWFCGQIRYGTERDWY